MKFRYMNLRPNEKLLCDACKLAIEGHEYTKVRVFLEDDIRSDFSIHRIICRKCLDAGYNNYSERVREEISKMTDWIDL